MTTLTTNHSLSEVPSGWNGLWFFLAFHPLNRLCYQRVSIPQGVPTIFVEKHVANIFLNTLSIRFPNCEVQTLIETKTGGKRQKPPHYLTGSKMISDLNYMRDPPQNMSICGGEIPLWTNCSHHSARLWGVVDSDGLRSLDLLLLEDRSILRLSQLPTVKGW